MSANPVYYAGNFEFGFWLLMMKHISKLWGWGRQVGNKNEKKKDTEGITHFGKETYNCSLGIFLRSFEVRRTFHYLFISYLKLFHRLHILLQYFYFYSRISSSAHEEKFLQRNCWDLFNKHLYWKRNGPSLGHTISIRVGGRESPDCVPSRSSVVQEEAAGSRIIADRLPKAVCLSPVCPEVRLNSRSHALSGRTLGAVEGRAVFLSSSSFM